MQRTRVLALALMAGGAAFGQAPAPAPSSFDVASVRLAQRTPGHEILRRDAFQFTPDSITGRGVTIRDAIAWAYTVMDYQITGPDWMAGQRYDIVAKAGQQVSEAQLRVMLQALLADRFKLAFHRQTKELPAFVLTIAKSGLKIKESGGEGDMDIKPDQGRLQITVQRAPVSQLVEVLARFLRAPIIDQTGLKGKYDVTISASKYIPDMEAARQAQAAGGAPMDPLPIIMNGLQEELGLKLDSKKVTLDLLVVDRAEKVPTEN